MNARKLFKHTNARTSDGEETNKKKNKLQQFNLYYGGIPSHLKSVNVSAKFFLVNSSK